MIDQQLEKVRDLYSTNIRANGIESKSVGWNSENGHMLRFEKLCSVIEKTLDPVSINDYGCGYGAILDYLIKKKAIEVSQYFGYDISTDMLDAAATELGWFKGKLDLISTSAINTKADYSIVSGTFNVRFESSDEEWSGFIKERLEMMNRMSTKGFAFNLLTSYVDWKEPHLYYGDPCFWFDYCKRHYSKKVNLLHDYDLWEWTITVAKD